MGVSLGSSHQFKVGQMRVWIPFSGSSKQVKPSIVQKVILMLADTWPWND